MIENVRLQNFRSYEDSTFEFDGGVNIIVGANGSGKTNLLEAVLVLCKGTSYRASDQDLIQHNKPWARIDGTSQGLERTVKFVGEGEKLKKQFTIGGTTLARLPLSRSVPVVVFEPNNLQLLTESPDLRRNFLDDIIEQITPDYGGIRRQYKRALAQRNRLLKQEFLPDQIFVWNLRLSELGGQIAEKRSNYTITHKEELAKLYDKLAGKKTKSDMSYLTKINIDSYGSSMLKELEKRTDVDRDRGYTTIGPHRDDIKLTIGGYVLSEAASRGETRTMLLALKLLEVQSVEKARNYKPVLLLDDVFSELDGSRRTALTKFLERYQTFITTTDADIVLHNFAKKTKIIAI